MSLPNYLAGYDSYNQPRVKYAEQVSSMSDERFLHEEELVEHMIEHANRCFTFYADGPFKQKVLQAERAKRNQKELVLQ